MSIFLNAVKGVNKEGRPPIWMMRQAGRYQSSYRQVRSPHSFLEMVKNPELASLVTLNALKEFDFDAGIIFSDILVVPEAMGMELVFDEKGPHFPKPLRSAEQFEQLRDFEPLNFLEKALKMTIDHTSVPVLGFAGAPLTLLSYMIEGKGGTGMEMTKAFLLSEPKLAHKTLEKIAGNVLRHLRSQIDWGAKAVQIFESMGSHFSEKMYLEFGGPYSEWIMSRLERNVPRILFMRGPWIHNHWAGSADVLSVDWMADLRNMIELSGIHKKAIQGNLEPAYLLGRKDVLLSEVKRMLQTFGSSPNWIFNLGHGIHKSSPEDNVRATVEAVKSWKP